MSTSILDVIGHYQRSIERAQKQNNPLAEGKSAKFLHCIEKLNRVPVKVEHLQATGIGKTVNSLRKYEGEVGIAAKALVAKWKAVVTAEEYAKEEAARNLRLYGNCVNNNDEDEGSRGDGSGNTSILPAANHNGYNRDNESAHSYQYSNTNNTSYKQQTTKQNSTLNFHQNHKLNNRQKDDNNTKMSIIKPSLPPIDPNYIHNIDDDEDDDNDVQLIIDENLKNQFKLSNYSNPNTVAKIKSDKYDKDIIKCTKNRDETSTNEKLQNLYNSERINISENQGSNCHLSNSNLLISNKVSNHKNNTNDMLNHEPPSAAEVCEEDMYSDRIPYENYNSDIGNDKRNSSVEIEEHKNTKYHKSSHNEGEVSSKKKKSKKHKDKKSKSKHYTHDEVNQQSDSKHEKKHKDKDKNYKEKSKDKRNKEVSDEKSDEKDNNKSGRNNFHTLNKEIYSERKNRLSNDFTSGTTPKKGKPTNNYGINNGIDYTTGASFEQALEMFSGASKKTKHQSKYQNDVPLDTPPINKKRLSRDEPSGSGIITKKQKLSTQINSNSDSESDEEIISNTPLLLSSANLTPLDPSIALELPAISNNYKPMPLNPNVMDCIFPQSKPQKLFTDEEAIAHGISSKTIRTKVYSGSKIGQKFQIPSLFNLCIRCLQKNIDALEYTGGVPFDVLKPVLERATPDQLMQFEEYNPYLMEDSDILWEQHVKRRFRSHKRQELESFRDMFMRCKESQDALLNKLTENIRQSQININLPQKKTQLAYVDSMVKPPRYVKKKQDKFGTYEKLVATPAARVATLSAITPNATKIGDVRLRVAAGTKDNAQATATPKGRKAPLMAKTLQFMKGRIRR